MAKIIQERSPAEQEAFREANLAKVVAYSERQAAGDALGPAEKEAFREILRAEDAARKAREIELRDLLARQYRRLARRPKANARALIESVRTGSSSRTFATKLATSLVDPPLRRAFANWADSRDRGGLLICANSTTRIPLAIACAPGASDLAELSSLIGEAITGGDCPYQVGTFLRALVHELAANGFPLFDSPEARAQWGGLPDRVTVYRGGLASEGQRGQPYGLSWTLVRTVAQKFADGCRFRRPETPTALFSAVVRRSDICGLLVDRGEDEALIVRPGKVERLGPTAVKRSAKKEIER